LEAVFVLLESSSPSRRIFIGSHSLSPPSLVRCIGPSEAIFAIVASVRAIAAVVEDELAASLLDHGELLEPLRQPVDPEGETLHT
jgi:hypothetical protein